MLIALALAVAPLVAAQRLPDPSDPADYASPSGEHHLHVDPVSRYGRGAADYEFVSHGVLVWSQRLPFAFQEAAVSNEGIVVGYSRPNRGGPRGTELGLVVAVLDATGKLAMQERWPFYATQVIHGQQHPLVLHLVPDFDHDRFYLNVLDHKSDPDANVTWAYSVADPKRTASFAVGTRLASLEQVEGVTRNTMDVALIHDTGLLLHHFSERVRNAGQYKHGARFALVDSEGDIKWSLTWPTDYEFTDASEDSHGLRMKLSNMDIVRVPGQRAQFELRRLETKQIITFAVRPDGRKAGDWLVEKVVSRADEGPLVPLKQVPSASPVESELKLVSEVQLEHVTAGAATPFDNIHLLEDVVAWAIADDGGCVILREDDDRVLHQLRMSEDGEFVQQLTVGSLPEAFDETFDQIQWVGQDRWLVTTSYWSSDEHQPLAIIDAQTGAVLDVPDLVAADFDGRPFSMESALGLKDGSLLGLGEYRNADTHALVCWTAEGEVRWITHQAPGVLTAPVDFAVTSDGLIAVLNDGPRLTTFSQVGEFLNTVDLEQSTGEALGSLLGIQAEQNGHLLIHDGSLLFRITVDGKLLDVLTPRALGEVRYRSHLAENAQCFEDGGIWTSDNRSLIRLSRTGLVEDVVDVPRTSGTIQGYLQSAILPGGRICIWDAGTREMNLWDESGKRLWIGKPQLGPAFNYDPWELYPIQTRGDEIWIQVGFPFDTGGISSNMGWDQAGQPVGVLAVNGSMAFVPDSRRYWTWTRDGGAVLHAEDGAQLAHVERLPNGRWLRDLSHISFGPLGEVYLQEKLSSASWSSSGYLVTCAPDGKALHAEWQEFDVHAGYETYEPNQWRTLRDGHQIYRPAGPSQPAQWLEVTGPISDRAYAHGISKDGLHLLTLDAATMTLFKRALPK